MTLMEQCQIWNDNDEYQKIVDAIEVLPEEERTPELCSSWPARTTIWRIPVRRRDGHSCGAPWICCGPMRKTLKDDHCWNFRMAYAYYYLDQEGAGAAVF